MDSSFLDTTLLSDPVLPTELKPSVLRPVAYRILSKKHGLNIQSDALESLAKFIGHHYGAHWRQNQKTTLMLDAVGRLWKQQSRGMFVNGAGVDEIIGEILENEKRARVKVNNQERSLVLDPDSSMIIDEDGDLSMDTSLALNFQVKPESVVDWMQYFRNVELNHYPGFKYDKRNKRLEYTANSSSESGKLLLPRINNFVDHFINKLYLLRDRTMRNEYYLKSSDDQFKSYDKSIAPKSFTFIKNLLGRNDQRFALFGMITLNSMGIWQLQDDTDKIELILDQCIFPQDSYFVEGNFLIVDGFHSAANKFHVLSVNHPPCEQRAQTKQIFGNTDCQWPFNKNGTSVESFRGLLKSELQNHPDHKIVFIGGDLFLDDSNTLNLLKKTLDKLEEEIKVYQIAKDVAEETGTDFESSGVPIGIVLIGSFSSKSITITEGSSTNHLTNSNLYKSSFDNLALVMESYPNICEKCKLFIVPGDKDPWMSMVTKDSNSIWPKIKIPQLFTNRLRRVVKHLEFISNPSRINYLGHEIAIVKDDLGGRFRRNDLTYLCKLSEEEIDKAMKNYPNSQLTQFSQFQTSSQTENPNSLEIDKLVLDESAQDFESKKIVKTILDQGDLSPFVNKIRPISSNYWNAMNLTPLPHFILLSDKTSPAFIRNYKGCEFANVGNFLVNGHANYIEYYPNSKRSKHQKLY